MDVSWHIHDELVDRSINAQVVGFGNISWDYFCSLEFAIFVCSTTGTGVETDDMKTFWRLMLRKSLAPDTLSNMKFACFGLGDSSYEK
ncbi:NADPH-dependent diflavin oxidoreductase 1 [Smittium culicis]|uniref:NADPH-dependent diflavin oxidoreductase 1 n=1 Tax=Smittium culicis TaxID=133412 RepID=A0A1R1YQX0_9FUNG|nr:NADPH-dependent diflavin oxidoreductase 1 [Smittium culicis]